MFWFQAKAFLFGGNFLPSQKAEFAVLFFSKNPMGMELLARFICRWFEIAAQVFQASYKTIQAQIRETSGISGDFYQQTSQHIRISWDFMGNISKKQKIPRRFGF